MIESVGFWGPKMRELINKLRAHPKYEHLPRLTNNKFAAELDRITGSPHVFGESTEASAERWLNHLPALK